MAENTWKMIFRPVVWFRISVMFEIFILASCEKENINDNLPCICQDLISVEDGNEELWTEYLGRDTTVLAFPDIYANYWTFTFKTAGLQTGLKISGIFPDCRYMNFALYSIPTAASICSLKDVDIKTDCCNKNPFISQNISDNEFYTLYVVPEGTRIDKSWLNVLKYDKKEDSVSLFLRYYVPENDDYASTELPVIEAFNTSNMEHIPLPDTFSLKKVRIDMQSISDMLSSFFQVEIVAGQDINFYNISSDLFYANPDNRYLATPITKKPGEVYMIRFKSPIFASTAEKILDTDVRYWSLTQSDISTRSFSGLKDEDAIVAHDGFVNIVIADDSPENRSKANGLNFIPWTIKSGKMILIYRNMLAADDFSGNIAKVPRLNGSSWMNVFLQASPIFIGDFAPAGKRMTTEEYLKNFGGMEVSY
jgi:hypothetical protein